MPSQNKPAAKRYPSELNERQWKKLNAYLPPPKGGGRPATDLRWVVNAILYVVKSGCTWRMLPNDYPHWATVYGYFNAWSKSGLWLAINADLVKRVRRRNKKKNGKRRKKRPSAAIIDSQSVKATFGAGSERGYDAGKRIKGRKRFILVDVLGLLLGVRVVAASVWEKEGAKGLLTYLSEHGVLKKVVRRVELVWADGGYQGPDLTEWVAQLWGWVWQIVKRNDDQKGFVVLPKRWIVERTFAWLTANRRLVRDYEKDPKNSESMLYIAMLPIMLNRL